MSASIDGAWPVCSRSELTLSALHEDFRERPVADLGHDFKMLRCGPSLRPVIVAIHS